MQNLKAPKKEKVVWKQKALGEMGRDQKAKKTPRISEAVLKMTPKEKKEKRKRLEQEISQREEQFNNQDEHRLGTTQDGRKREYFGGEGLKQLEENKELIAELKIAIQEDERREKVLAEVRRGKEQRLATVQKKTREIDERLKELDHIPLVSRKDVEKNYLDTQVFKQDRDEYLLNKKLEEKYLAELKEPDEEPKPKPKRTMSEEDKQRAAWRKELAAFRPTKVFAERAREGAGKAIEDKYGEAVEQAEIKEYDEGIKLLRQATLLAKNAKRALKEECEKVGRDTKNAAAEQKEAFNFTTEVKDKEWGFDADDDAPNFYLANSVNGLGGLETSPQLKKMQQVYADCLERRDQLKKMGTSIDQIVEAVYKNIPKNFWPDDVVKEVLLYKAAKEEIEAEERLAQSEMDLEGVMEKVEEVPGFIGEQSTEAWEYALMVDQIKQKFPEAKDLNTSKVTDALSHFSDICSALSDTTMGFLKGASALEIEGERKETEDNPVKTKILEFQRNKALIDCANSLVSAGLDVAGEAVLAEAVPLLGVISGSKNALLDIAGAVTYFKNLAYIAGLKKGAAIDPRTAALLPLARQAREQKIAASDKLVSAVANILSTLGKSAELGAMTAPVGMVVDVAGKVVRYAGKIVISGINWSDASKAVKTIKLAAGPPPNRKAQFQVMQHSTKYARVALAQLARDGDSWAIGHLENIGLGREDINHEATSNKLLREYMVLKSGGTFADGIGEEQQTFGETKVARAAKFIGRGIVKGAEKIRDLIVGRDTSIDYDAGWRIAAGDAFTPGVWPVAYKEAIDAGWYDSRPDIDADLSAYRQARGNYDGHLPSGPEDKDLDKGINDASTLITALVALRNQTRSIKAVANDRKTTHAGMAAFLDAWGRKADEEVTAVTNQRSDWIARKAFPDPNKKGKTLEGEALETAKKDFLQKAETKAREIQKEKAANVRQKIDELWKAHKIPSPYGSSTITDFAAKAVKELKLDEEAAKALASQVEELGRAFHERLSQEVMAAPDERELEKRFKNSVQTIDPLAVESLRAACERQYQAMQKRNGAVEGTDDWTPGGGDVALKASAWAGVEQAATKKGWKKGKSTGLAAALKNYEEALAQFVEERDRSPQNQTKVEQTQGVLLGRIDELVTALENFQPLTDKQFVHPGLSAWRDGMVDECASARVAYGAPLFE